MKVSRFIWLSAGVLICAILATSFSLGWGKTQARVAALTACSQPAVVDAERGAPFLDLKRAHVIIPQGEPQIVATVNGHSFTAIQLEMLVQNAVYNNQATLARLGPGVTPGIQAQLTRSSTTLRQMLLTKLIDDDLWLAQGKQHGKYASIADAQKLLAQSVALAHQSSVNDPAYIQFTAFLCVNNLTEASYQTDPRVVHMVQDQLTIAAVKAQIHSTLSPAQQRDRTAMKATESTYVQSLWTTNKVQVFLPGFTPLRG